MQRSFLVISLFLEMMGYKQSIGLEFQEYDERRVVKYKSMVFPSALGQQEFECVPTAEELIRASSVTISKRSLKRNMPGIASCRVLTKLLELATLCCCARSLLSLPGARGLMTQPLRYSSSSSFVV